jgi:hypothetical protein
VDPFAPKPTVALPKEMSPMATTRTPIAHEPYDTRREAVGGFARPVGPTARVGTYGSVVLLRRQGAGSYAGDPDRQRQGSSADTDVG